MAAPISIRTSTTARRLGFNPTPWKSVSEFGSRRVAAMRKAAEERSPGTVAA